MVIDTFDNELKVGDFILYTKTYIKPGIITKIDCQLNWCRITILTHTPTRCVHRMDLTHASNGDSKHWRLLKYDQFDHEIKKKLIEKAGP